VHVNVTITLVLAGRSVTCVELDLDVVPRPRGRVEVLVEDEFLEHQVLLDDSGRGSFGGPPGLETQARPPKAQPAEATDRLSRDSVDNGSRPYNSRAAWALT